MTAPWKDLSKKVQDAILNGTGEEEITITYDDGLRSYKTKKPFEGVIGNIERRWRETDSNWMREELARYQSDQPCRACNGQRLKPQALAVKIDNLHISQVASFPFKTAIQVHRPRIQATASSENRRPHCRRSRPVNSVDVVWNISISRHVGSLPVRSHARLPRNRLGLTAFSCIEEPSRHHQRDNARFSKPLHIAISATQ